MLTNLGASDTPRGLLTDSVIKAGQVQSGLANATKDERVARWQKMATDPNPYSRIAAAKALCVIDPNAAKAALLKLEAERSEIKRSVQPQIESEEGLPSIVERNCLRRYLGLKLSTPDLKEALAQ